MRANEAICGLVLLVFSVTMAALTIPFPEFPGQHYGPDLLPRILAVTLSICGIILVVRGLRARRNGEAWLTFPTWFGQRAKVFRFVLVIAALLFYILAADTLGFVPVSFIIILVLSVSFGARPFPAVVTAVLATAGINYFFASIMRVPLPRGLLDLMM